VPSDAGMPIAPLACGMALPGPALNMRLSEAKPGYFEELAALTLPDQVNFGNETRFQLALLQYMTAQNTSTSLSRQYLEDAGPLGRAVLGAAAKSTRPGEVDFTFLRRGLYTFYPCTTQFPASLTELKRKYGDYTQWAREDLACGTAKDGPRRLWENFDGGIFIAETLSDAGIRETEVIFTKLRRDNQLSFAVYTAEGFLSDRSTFPTLGAGPQTLASPYTCMSCHFNTTTNTLTDLRPVGTGTGCRPPRDSGVAPDAGP
jgi:hypothetical protein